MCFMGRTCCRNNFAVFISFGEFLCGRKSCTHSASNKNSFYGEMKNDKLWQMETMNWVRALLMCHMWVLAMEARHGEEKSWRRRRQWRAQGGERENVRMKWLYGSICNAIKWTLNMHNNPLLLSTSICQPPRSTQSAHTRMSWIAGKTIISLLLRYNIFFCFAFALFHFWTNWTHEKSFLYNSLPLQLKASELCAEEF